jgi:NitT/TauT family transport system substrate-binding protein
MRVAYNAVTAELGPAFIGDDEGIYKKHGLDVELVHLQSSAQIAPALIAQEIGIAFTAGAGTAAARLQGADLVMVSDYRPYMDFTLYARPEIRRVEDLKGKRLGVTRFGGGLHLAALIILERHGLDPERDVALSQLGGTPEIFAALSGGAVDAGMFTSPEIFLADDQGYTRLKASLDYQIPYTMAGTGASQRFLRENEDLARRFMRAHVESLGLFLRDKDAAKRSIARWTKQDDASILERAYTHVASSTRRIPYVEPASIQTVLDQLAPQVEAARTAKADEFIDNRYLRELEDSGFLRQVYP